MVLPRTIAASQLPSRDTHKALVIHPAFAAKHSEYLPASYILPRWLLCVFDCLNVVDQMNDYTFQEVE